MTSHESKINLWKEKLDCKLINCGKCKECKVNTKVIFKIKLPAAIIYTVNSYIECVECTIIKQLIKKEPVYTSEFYHVVPEKYYREYCYCAEGLYELYVLSYYCTMLHTKITKDIYKEFCIDIRKNFYQNYSLGPVKMKKKI